MATIYNDKVIEYGRELLNLSADIYNTIDGAAERLEALTDKANAMTNSEKMAYNDYINLVSITQSLALKVLAVYTGAEADCRKALNQIALSSVLFTAEKQTNSLPIILAPDQQGRITELQHPKTKADQLQTRRAELYGVALLMDAQRFYTAPGDKEYKPLDLLHPFYKSYGINNFLGSTEKAEMLRAGHYKSKQTVIHNLIIVYRFNKLIEAIAEEMQAPEFNNWQINTDTVSQLINEYNALTNKLCCEYCDNIAVGIAQSLQRYKGIEGLLKHEFCNINADKLLSEDYYYTKEDAKQLSKIAKAPLKMRVSTADQFLERVPNDIDIISAVEYKTPLDDAEEVS